MQKLRNYLAAIEARDQERKAQRKAHWESISPLRRCAYRMVYGLIVAILIIGLLTKTVHTASFFAMALLFVPTFILRAPQWRRHVVINTLLTPILTIPAILALGGLTLDFDYADAMRRQSLVLENTDKVAQDAEQFLADYRAGNLGDFIQIVHAEGALKLGMNDRTAYDAAEKLSGLLHLSAPKGLDTSAILPIGQAIYATRTIALYNKKIAKKYMEESKVAYEAGRNATNKSADKIAPAQMPNSYKGISLLFCSVRDDGEVLSVTGPSTSYMELKDLSAAAPLAEVCRLAALDAAGADQSGPKRTAGYRLAK